MRNENRAAAAAGRSMGRGSGVEASRSGNEVGARVGPEIVARPTPGSTTGKYTRMERGIVACVECLISPVIDRHLAATSIATCSIVCLTCHHRMPRSCLVTRKKKKKESSVQLLFRISAHFVQQLYALVFPLRGSYKPPVLNIQFVRD